MSRSFEQSLWCIIGAALSPVVLIAPSYATQYLSIEEAKQVCFPTATHFDGATLTLSDEQQDQIELLSGIRPPSSTVRTWRAFIDSELIGTLLLDHVIGKHLLIDYVLAINPDGSVKQIEILEYRENYGDEVRNAAWREAFVGKTVDSRLELREDIPRISGATYSTLHVTEGVRRLLRTYAVLFK